MTSIKGEEDLNAWLEGRPPKVAQVVSMRASLRVLPQCAHILAVPDAAMHPQNKLSYLAAVFRCAFITWAAQSHNIGTAGPYLIDAVRALDGSRSGNLTSHPSFTDMDVRGHLLARLNSSNMATSSIRTAALLGSRVDTEDPTKSLAHALDAVTASTNSTHIYAPSDAVRLGTRGTIAAMQAGLWAAIEGDAIWLDQRGASANEDDEFGVLGAQPLWPNGDFPSWLRETWNNLETLDAPNYAGDANFRVWFGWYRGRIAGMDSISWRGLGREGGEQLDTVIAKQPDSWWNREPAVVNSDLIRLIEEARGRSDTPPEISGSDEARSPQSVVQATQNSGVSELDQLPRLQSRPETPIAGPGPQYEILNGKLTQTASNPDVGEIDAQAGLHRHLVRAAQQLSLDMHRLGNQHPRLANTIKEYAEIVNSELPNMDVVAAWSVGGSLAAFALAYSDQNSMHSIEEPLEPQIAGQLQSVVRQHGAFILGFAEGRTLVERADEFATDRQRLEEIEAPGNAILHELAENRDLVEEQTRGRHQVIRDAAVEFGWVSGRIGFAAYLTIRNATLRVLRTFVGSDLSVVALLSAPPVLSAYLGDPNMEVLKASLPYLQNHAQNLLIAFNHSPEMRAYTEWALHLLKIDSHAENSKI
jgi:hypothetical protein